MIIFASRDFCMTWPADGHVSLLKKQCVRRTSISDDSNIIMILHVISIIVCERTSAHTGRICLYYTSYPSPKIIGRAIIHVGAIGAPTHKAQPIVFSQPFFTTFSCLRATRPTSNAL